VGWVKDAMISFGAVYGGPEIYESPIADTIRRLKKARVPREEGPFGSLVIVFHVPGSIIQPEYEGVRTARFSRKQRTLTLQIAVPAEQTYTPDLDFLLNAIRKAIGMARPRFERAGVRYPEREYLDMVDRIEKELKH
jgi:hypothetical protein